MEFEDETPRRKPTCCLRCGYAMTWEAQRRQFGRLLHRGLTAEEAKALMPRCQVCITATLLGRKAGSPMALR